MSKIVKKQGAIRYFKTSLNNCNYVVYIKEEGRIYTFLATRENLPESMDSFLDKVFEEYSEHSNDKSKLKNYYKITDERGYTKIEVDEEEEVYVRESSNPTTLTDILKEIGKPPTYTDDHEHWANQ